MMTVIGESPLVMMMMMMMMMVMMMAMVFVKLKTNFTSPSELVCVGAGTRTKGPNYPLRPCRQIRLQLSWTLQSEYQLSSFVSCSHTLQKRLMGTFFSKSCHTLWLNMSPMIWETCLIEDRKWVLGGTLSVSSGFTVECPRNVHCTKLQDSQHAIFAVTIHFLRDASLYHFVYFWIKLGLWSPWSNV